MKRTLSLILAALSMLSLLLVGCSRSHLDPEKPVTLTMWHVYGEQVGSPMNQLINEFNATAGKEKGIIIDTTLMSNSMQIGEKLLSAQNNKAGAGKMPDLFFCHNNDVGELGADRLIDWKDYFTEEELKHYIPDFIDVGMVDNRLSVFPVAKSTYVLFIAGTQFDRFSKATGVSYDDLSTWDSFFDAAAKYYKWSGGKPFCAFDYLIRAVDLNALGNGGKHLYTEDGQYDFNNPALKSSYLKFADAIVKGHIIVSDLYANTQVSTGEVIAGFGSSAAILYYNDTVMYPDNTSELANIRVVPMPKAKGGPLLASQAGAGLCAYKTTEQKAEAAAFFAKWLTESQRNLAFCASAGYMPVTKQAFDQMPNYDFKNESYRSLYSALDQVYREGSIIKKPPFPGYLSKSALFYDTFRKKQIDYHSRFKNGESPEKLSGEAWDLFRRMM